MAKNDSANTLPNIWEAQENTIHLYQKVVIGLSIGLVLTISLLIATDLRDPIVVMAKEDALQYYPTERRALEVGKPEIETFTKQFLKALYVWTEYKTDQLRKEIGPFVDERLIEKLISGQAQKYEKDLKGKKLAQAITFVEVEVLSDRVVARLDRVLKLDGVPLIIPTEVTVNMIQGESTQNNPMGIFITGVTENEGSK